MRQMMAIVAFAALGGVTLTSTAASAMPNGMTATAKQVVGQTSNIQEVRWVRDARGRRVWRAGPRDASLPSVRAACGVADGAAPTPGPLRRCGVRARCGARARDGVRDRDGAGIAAGGDAAAGTSILLMRDLAAGPRRRTTKLSLC
jgi:hypothetical protein